METPREQIDLIILNTTIDFFLNKCAGGNSNGHLFLTGSIDPKLEENLETQISRRKSGWASRLVREEGRTEKQTQLLFLSFLSSPRTSLFVALQQMWFQ
jgi:hypothetical protein